MASIVEQTPFNEYTGNGVTTAFGFEFQLLNNGDFVASIDGVEIPSSDYTLSSLTQAGGTCTFDTAPANGAAVLLQRVIALARDTDYQYNGDLREETLDRDFNRLWQALQGQAADLGGALRLPYPEQAAAFPAAADRINKLIGFNALGELALTGPADGTAASLAQQLADPTAVGNGDAMLAVKWTGTPGVATTQHQVNEDRPTMMMSLADSLKAAIRALSSTTDVTAQVQAYMQYCYDNNKEAIFPAGRFSVTSIALTANGGELSGGMKWTGAGKNATIIKQLGSGSTPLITVTGASNPTTISLMARDMTLEGNGKTCPGLKLDTIAGFHFDNFTVRDFTVGLDLASALIGSAINTSISRNNIGVRARQNGANAFCNLLTFGEGCQIIFNTQFGLDIGACDTLNVGYGCQIESNGVNQSTSTVTVTSATPAVVSWTAHGLVAEDPVIFTNSGGALPTGITADYIYYVSATGLTANAFQFSLTPGGASVATSSTGTGTHTASSPKTGGIVIRDTVVDELGAVTVNINAARFEGNFGSDFRSEYMNTAFGLYLNFTDCLMAGTSDGPMIAVGFARKVSIKGCVAPVGSSTWNVNTDQLLLENSKVINLRRPGGANTITTTINSGFGGIDFPSGEEASYTGTATGLTTSPTNTVSYNVQGNAVELRIGVVTGTSNTTTFTITGGPDIIKPRAARPCVGVVRDNGVDKVCLVSVGTNGTLTFDVFTAFTSSGTKGVDSAFSIQYQK